MKKLLVFIFSTLLIVVAFDVLLGVASVSYIKSHDLPGRYRPLDRLIKKVEPDVLILGNSIALNDFVPHIISDSTGLTCYNGGIEGQGMDFFETVLDCVLQRHIPKMLILGLRVEELGQNVGDGIYDVLRPYYHTGYSSIDQHFDNRSSGERLLLHSSLYRYNIIWARILLYTLFDNTHYSPDGELMKPVPAVAPQLQHLQNCDTPIQWKLDCLERMLKRCHEKGIKAYVCFPPELYHFPVSTPPCIEAVLDLCKKYDAECFVDHEDSVFHSAPQFFADNVHLNADGAAKYTQIFVSRLSNR